MFAMLRRWSVAERRHQDEKEACLLSEVASKKTGVTVAFWGGLLLHFIGAALRYTQCR
jgi:hypothetical protein